MIKVKLSTYEYYPFKETVLSQTPGLSGGWREFKFYINEDVEECDYWVIFDYLPRVQQVKCSSKNIIFIAGESTSIRSYNYDFLKQFSKIITCQKGISGSNVSYMSPGLSWRPKKTYDELKYLKVVPKNKILSVITSSKSWTSGHRKRLNFCLKLKKHFGDSIDIFGSGIRDFDDKWNVLAPYKYSIAIENSVEMDWMTEKIGDCFTTLTFPFYFGCPNIDKYYNPNSYQLIDMDDFEKSCKIISEIINDEGHYDRHLRYLVESKDRYINEHSLIPLIANFIETNFKTDKIENKELIALKPESIRKGSFIKKVFRKLINLFISILLKIKIKMQLVICTKLRRYIKIC